MSKSRINRPNSKSGSVGQFLKSRSKYFHTSCNAYMVSQPSKAEPMFPYVEPGRTYNAGRNQAKRDRLALSKHWTSHVAVYDEAIQK